MFDGLHIGHQSLLEMLEKKCRELPQAASSLVISFYPHPDMVLRGKDKASRITTLRQTLKLLADYRVEALVLHRFTQQLAALKAEEFINTVLFKELNVSHLILGPDAALGRNRQADAHLIADYFTKAGRKSLVMPWIEFEGRRVSSDWVRELIGAGKWKMVRAVLGRSYALEGRIQRGDRRGRKLGFPTANLIIKCQILPPRGVYAAWACLDGVRLRAVSNVGARPTFGGQRVILETHILERALPDLYGRRLEVQIVDQIRAEAKFENAEKLKAQIERDIRQAKEILT